MFPLEYGKMGFGGGGDTPEFTGHIDKNGLRTIGFTEEDIEWYEKKGVNWNSEYDDVFKLNSTELAGNTSNKTRYFPNTGASAPSNFSGYKRLIAIPKEAISDNVTSFYNMFEDCRSLRTIPNINTSKVKQFYNAFNNCYSLNTIPELDTSNGTSFQSMFSGCYSLNSIPNLKTGKGTEFTTMFRYCYALRIAPQLDTSNSTTFSSMFSGCYSLSVVPELEAGKVRNVRLMFDICYSLVEFGGLKDLGKAYLTSSSENYSDYTLDLSSCEILTHDSLMNVINNLYDIKSKGCKLQKLQLGSENLAKLSETEKQVAIDKGWNLT